MTAKAAPHVKEAKKANEPKTHAVHAPAGAKAAQAPVKKAEPRKSDVYFNGKYLGKVSDPYSFITDMKNKRRLGVVPDQVNMSYNSQVNEIRINSESGRARRPLVIVESGKPRLTEDHIKKMEKNEVDWNYLVKHGIIEYLDAEEEENAYIAMFPNDVTPEHTHMEINPVAAFGLPATLIPYSDYNRGDRVNYGAKMVGQAIGLPTDNFLIRMDTKFNTMVYPQQPVVETDTYKILQHYPNGQNVVVAVMCWDGYNMNDAIVMNKSSVDRGMFRSFYYRTYETEKKKYWGGQEDEIKVPEAGIRGYKGETSYKDLDVDGIINLETRVGPESVLVGKVSPLRFLSGQDFASDIENRRETSVTIRYGERGMVDTILISENTNGNQLIKIRTRDQMIPELGDKFASRHGQKGVVSLLVPHEDMPFTSQGVVPDILFNPHGIPSRMTIGQLLELVAGKAGALRGSKINATAFGGEDEPSIRTTMKQFGFRDDGYQTLYDGRTGKAYKVLIFTGISYYLKLDHMVANKMHARAKGPVTLLTKQPTEGRAKRGGLRLGEMEQQCLVGHGAAMVLKERFNSDRTTIPICAKCGLIAINDRTKNKTYCQICKESEIVWVDMAYAFKLTMDEFKSMGIYPHIRVSEV